jgi:hypothetical protein
MPPFGAFGESYNQGGRLHGAARDGEVEPTAGNRANGSQHNSDGNSG